MQLISVLKNRGFTLIEIIMVVVLLGMMSVFIVPNYTKSVSKAYEKSGSDNLLIVYAGQNIYKNTNSVYIACGDVNAINVNLSLGIIGNGFNYSCTTSDPTVFNCQAARVDGSFTVQITNDNSVVCCAAGACPSAAACS